MTRQSSQASYPDRLDKSDHWLLWTHSFEASAGSTKAATKPHHLEVAVRPAPATVLSGSSDDGSKLPTDNKFLVWVVAPKTPIRLKYLLCIDKTTTLSISEVSMTLEKRSPVFSVLGSDAQKTHLSQARDTGGDPVGKSYLS